MSVLKGIEPASVFKIFEDISAIPRGSYNEKAVSDYVVRFAKEHDIKCRQDEQGNVILHKPATKGYEDEKAIALQGHLDMVCEKKKGSDHDFTKDPLKLKVKDGFVSAKDTTLGADDGVAVAMALALMADKSLKHPRMYVILTVAEEVGMEGAIGIDLSKVKAKRLINIDSEDEGVFTAGCAGGVTCEVSMNLTREKQKGFPVTIEISDLTGGHSGTEIHKNRANASKLLGRVLNQLRSENIEFFLKSMRGGTKQNAIPVNASAELIVKKKMIPLLEEAVAQAASEISVEYAVSDPGLSVNVTVDKNKTVENVLDNRSFRHAMTLLNTTPNGVVSYSQNVEGLVETSVNLGIMSIEKKNGEFVFLVRSSLDSAKHSLLYNIKNLCEVVNAEFAVSGDYPAWEYRPDSPLRNKAIAVFEEMFNKKPKIDIIHAGLECGIFASKIRNMDAISIGPDLYDIHTTSERMSIASVDRTYRFVRQLIETKD